MLQTGWWWRRWWLMPLLRCTLSVFYRYTGVQNGRERLWGITKEKEREEEGKIFLLPVRTAFTWTTASRLLALYRKCNSASSRPLVLLALLHTRSLVSTQQPPPLRQTSTNTHSHTHTHAHTRVTDKPTDRSCRPVPLMLVAERERERERASVRHCRTIAAALAPTCVA